MSSEKEAKARVKINKLLEEANWRLLDDEHGRANVDLEYTTKIKRDDKFKTGLLDYLMLDSKAFKKTIANIDKIINNFDEETAILFEINYKYNVKKYDKIHENSYEDMRKYMLEKNYELTKAVYCDGFDEEAEFFIKKKIKRIKNEVPDLYLD